MTSSPEREFVSALLDDLHADLDAWLRIPSISADPAHAPDVAASAEWLADALRRRGEAMRLPNEFWPHHGSLQKQLREDAEDALRNTPDLPLMDAQRNQWIADGRPPSALAQNCSGKHAAMLATSVLNDCPRRR